MNKAILLGRLTKDPELAFVPGSGTAYSRFTIAVAEPKKNGVEQQANFINCVAFGKTGETIAQYLVKGRQIAVVGRIKTGSYEAKDGTKRYTTDIMVESFDFISDSKSNTGTSNTQSGRYTNQNKGLTNQLGDPIGTDNWDDMMPYDDGDMPF